MGLENSFKVPQTPLEKKVDGIGAEKAPPMFPRTQSPEEIAKEKERAKSYTDEEKKITAMRERVDRLRDTDNNYQDTAYDLVLEEKKFREEDLAADGVSGAAADRLADKYSDAVLKKIEAEKRQWMDEMTGLRNKNALIKEFPQLLNLLIRRAREKNEEWDCSILMIDFDDFKKVNTEQGHSAGDQALKQLAEIINGSISRGSDVMYRFGGEEFVVMLPGSDIKTASELAEKIRLAVEESVIKVTNKEGEEVNLKKTISTGCMDLKDIDGIEEILTGDMDDDKLRIILNGANKALGEAKSTGKNKVVAYHDVESESLDSFGLRKVA